MKKRFLPLSMLLITMVLAQASLVANATGDQGKYNPRKGSEATVSSFMRSIRANQETGLVDPALIIAGRKTAQSAAKGDNEWNYAGPDNFGGVVKAVIYNNDGTVIIGTVGGDIYQTSNNGITFRKIASLNSEIYSPISCMTKADDGTIYIGTGDSRDSETFGFGDLGDGGSFMGNGIYKMAANGTITHLSSTASWIYVNEIAITNNKIYAATDSGIMVSNDKGASWESMLTGRFRSVKANNSGDILAADDNTVYLSNEGNTFDTIPNLSASANNNPKIIAMSETDANIMYIAYLGGTAGSYTTSNIYFTYDGGDDWVLAMSENGMYSIFGSNANYDGYMIVHPNSPRKVFIGSDNLWVFENKDTNQNTMNEPNSFEPKQISENNCSEYSPVAWNRYYYLHQGIQSIAFNPGNANEFFIGTVGGVYKGIYQNGLYSYSSSNRYFLTDEEHTSTARMMSVAVGGTSIAIGGSVDHGTLAVYGNENINNATTGYAIFPNPTSITNTFGYFTKDYAGGPCAISTIDPYIVFVSGTGNLSMPIHRSETFGADYDDKNFSAQGAITNSSAYRTPFALHENYLKEYHTGITIQTESGPEFINFDTLNYSVKDTMAVGTPIVYYSTHAGYPFSTYAPALPDSLQNDDHKINGEYVWMPGDTIRNLHDSINTTFVCGIKNKVYMTREALVFNAETIWLELGAITGTPTAVALSADGDIALVGTVEGKLYKFPYLSEIFVKEQLVKTDAQNYIYQGVEFLIQEFAGQAITSIAFDPKDNDHIILTLGNYGEDFKHVYVSYNGTDFNAVAGNGLPDVPAYSCLIEKMENTEIFVGTEMGMYVSSDNGANWDKSGAFTTPVMDIKQAIEPNHPNRVVVKVDELGTPTYYIYPGVVNEGMIYAGTYGNGIIVNDSYYVAPETLPADDDEDETVVTTTTLNVYPNPVKDNAQININLDEDASVSYVIYDFAGRQIISNELGAYVKGAHTLNINTSNLSKGSYVIRIKAGDKTESGKFLVY